MKKKSLSILLAVFMILGTFVNVVYASGLGDNPTIHDVLHTRSDFAFGNNVRNDGWSNSNGYILFCQYGDDSDLSLIYDDYFSNEISVNQTEITQRDGNNYKITTTDGVNGGNIVLLFVMNNGVLDYIEVTAPNSPSVAGVYAKRIRNLKEFLSNKFTAFMEKRQWLWYIL